jgi:HK97 gp10 family phage protein
MNVKVSITGINEIDQAVKNLPLAFQHSTQQAAHVAAAKPLVERMKLLAPEGPTGNLVDSVGIVRMNMSRATNVGEIQVGPRRGRFKGGHGHLNEFGTKPRRLRGRGKYKAGTERGVMPKHPFVQPAFSQTKGEVEKAIAVNVGKSVVRLIKRYVK